MPRIILFLTLMTALLALSLSGCQKADLQPALNSITAEDLSKDIRILSSDEFEGRSPSSEGEVKSINYIKEEYEKIGLLPGNKDSYFQEVPMVSITASPGAKLNILGNRKTNEFTYADEFMATTMRVTDTVSLKNSEMIFVGYGTVAPEYKWNDYEGLDVRGKTVVMLVNDPGFATQDPSLFNGNAMTYYGRWTYKYEEAARQGAEAAFIIHETKPASYPWDVVKNSWSGPQFSLITDDNNMSRCAIEGWFTIESTRKIFEQAGLDFDKLKADAAKPGFKAVPMNLNATMTLQNTIQKSSSNNVIGVLPGRARADEYIFYTAHWDHLGMDPSKTDDPIYNGALDNATGVAGLIELAQAFAKLPSPPERSIVFLAVTAEEQGLLGSQYYAEHPIFPLTKTVAEMNMDALNIYGKMKDIILIGYGYSDLDDYVKSVASEMGRMVRPDQEPEKGHFYRSDHFSFAKQGVPAIYIETGEDSVEHGEEWTKKQKENYTANNYHKPSDEFDPDWDLSGMVDDLQLLFRVGYKLGMEDTFPNWKEGTEFKAKRDKDMQAVAR